MVYVLPNIRIPDGEYRSIHMAPTTRNICRQRRLRGTCLGVQFEAGSGATSYILTTNRATDQVTVELGGFQLYAYPGPPGLKCDKGDPVTQDCRA